MYSPLIVDQNLFALEKRGFKVKRQPVDKCREMSARLNAAYDLKNGVYTRRLTPDEQSFVRSETALCRADFSYFAQRYGNIDLDASVGGGVGPMQFWASQERALQLIGQREEEVAREFAKHGFCDGILTIWHKSRQLGATAIMRLITLHRMLLFKNTRGIAGSLDIDKIHELYVRDKTILDNLPPFLSPRIQFDVKDSHISFDNLKSRLTYQQSNQKAGVGTGQQFDVSHMTEVALWDYADRLKFDFLPTVPQAPTAFVAFESTANGRGNFWFSFTESVRKKEEGFGAWTYIFTPSYIEPTKYRRTPPDDWRPNQVTIEYAELVERTSPEYCSQKVVLGRDHLYWWETEYTQYRKEGSLHIFLSNYCVAGDSRISTPDGIIRIDSARDTKAVESGEVTAWMDQGEKDVVRLVTANDRRLTLTPDHRVFTADGKAVRADELKCGQKIALAPPILSQKMATLAWNPIPCQTNSVLIDEAWGRFLGYYMGDGCFYNGAVDVACASKDEDVIEEVADAIKTLVGGNIVHERHGVGCVSVRSYNQAWKPLLKAMGAIRLWDNPASGWTRHVCVPDVIWRSPRAVVREFLSALFEADGHAYPYWARTSLSSKYGGFLRDVQLLLLAFGINSKITAIEPKLGQKTFTASLLALGAEASERFHQVIGFRSERKQSARVGVKHPGKGAKRQPNEMADAVSFIMSHGRARVYDLTVAVSHRFGANGILVHNCATPEQSFQHSTCAALPIETIEWMRNTAVPGMPYNLTEVRLRHA